MEVSIGWAAAAGAATAEGFVGALAVANAGAGFTDEVAGGGSGAATAAVATGGREADDDDVVDMALARVALLSASEAGIGLSEGISAAETMAVATGFSVVFSASGLAGFAADVRATTCAAFPRLPE
jgi:hypothetical protein